MWSINRTRVQFFVTVPSSKSSSMFENRAVISPGTVRGCFDTSFAVNGST